MLTYPHVEDYLEYLAGYEVGITGILTPPQTDRISLARYDVRIVESMANNTMYGTALTDRQAELAVKLIVKYRRQFSKLGIDVTPVETPQYRIEPRKIDRVRAIWIEDEQIKIKFPYDTGLIELLREFKDTSQGKVVWNPKIKSWTAAITEYNVNFLVTWANQYHFTVSDDILDLFDRIITCEHAPYKIELVLTDRGYSITNAADSLVNYINERLGGFGPDNLVKLVDHAGVLGYTVSPDILEHCSREYGPALEYIGTRHRTHLSPISDPGYWDWILEYAELTERYPICIYDPGIVGEIDLSRFSEKDIVRFDHNGKTNTSDYSPYDVKVIYARKIPKAWDFPVPLLVSTVEMMYGGKRLEWINRAEKIIYFTNTIINEKI